MDATELFKLMPKGEKNNLVIATSLFSSFPLCKMTLFFLFTTFTFTWKRELLLSVHKWSWDYKGIHSHASGGLDCCIQTLLKYSLFNEEYYLRNLSYYLLGYWLLYFCSILCWQMTKLWVYIDSQLLPRITNSYRSTQAKASQTL